MAGQPALIRVAKALHWEIEGRPVAAVEQREAAFGGEAVVKPDTAVVQVNPVIRIYDRFAIGRSLALLGSCYKDYKIRPAPATSSAAQSFRVRLQRTG